MSRRRYVILTPFAQSEVVAGVLRLRGYDAAVIPTKSGTVVVRDIPTPSFDDWDISELLGSDESSTEKSEPDAVGASDADPRGEVASSDVDPSDNPDEVAGQLSKLSKYGVVLMLAELGDDVGLEEGVSGLVHAHRVINGQRTEELSAGLVLNQVDDVVEELLIGKEIDAIAGVIEREDVTPTFLERFMGRGRRKSSAPETRHEVAKDQDPIDQEEVPQEGEDER